jgi:hypothetical protein
MDEKIPLFSIFNEKAKRLKELIGLGKEIKYEEKMVEGRLVMEAYYEKEVVKCQAK